MMMLRLQQFRICNTRQALSVAFLAIALVQALCDLSVVWAVKAIIICFPLKTIALCRHVITEAD
jgi:hypothetical protein